MLSRRYRASRTNIENAIKTGITVSESLLYAKVSRPETEKAGFAIVVSKKIEKTSVGRHQIKRRISAAIEANIGSMQENFKKTIVFFPRKTEKSPSYKEIKKDTEEIFKKTSFYRA